jgi:hypothetical protein
MIDHVAASSGLYVGSPSIAVLPNGGYVASHDFFGPKSNEFQSARTVVFCSGDMWAWLEGNAVVAPDGQLLDVLRVQTRSPDEKAAIVHISADGKTASFDPRTGFVDFPGGAKKFAIRFDPQSKRYWSLASIVHQRHRADNPGDIRNTLALTSSVDLKQWTVRCVVLYHPDTRKHAFQYVDWLFEGNDLIAVCRTAYDDGQGGAHNNHDANFLTFHRIADFRTKTLAGSAETGVASGPTRHENPTPTPGRLWQLRRERVWPTGPSQLKQTAFSPESSLAYED